MRGALQGIGLAPAEQVLRESEPQGVIGSSKTGKCYYCGGGAPILRWRPVAFFLHLSSVSQIHRR
jgi:hypothetical protein